MNGNHVTDVSVHKPGFGINNVSVEDACCLLHAVEMKLRFNWLERDEFRDTFGNKSEEHRSFIVYELSVLYSFYFKRC